MAHYGWVVSIEIVLTVLALSIELIINSIKIKEINGKLLIIGMSSMFILQSVLLAIYRRKDILVYKNA